MATAQKAIVVVNHKVIGYLLLVMGRNPFNVISCFTKKSDATLR